MNIRVYFIGPNANIYIIKEVSLYLTSLGRMKSEPLAVFSITSLSTAWNKIAVRVEGSNVKLYINCELVDSASVARSQRIEFDPASSLYIGQGGAKYKKPWEGVIQVLYYIYVYTLDYSIKFHPFLKPELLSTRMSHPFWFPKGRGSKLGLVTKLSGKRELFEQGWQQ